MVTYKDVNKGIKEVVDYMKSIEWVWGERRTMKLKDLFYALDDIVKDYPRIKKNYGDVNNLFDVYVNQLYDRFVDDLALTGVKECRVYVGSSSTFYLTNVFSQNRWDERQFDLDYLIDAVYGEWGRYCGFHETKNGWEMIPFEDDEEYGTVIDQLENSQDEMDYFANGGFLQEVKDYFENAVKYATILDQYLDCQIEDFKEWANIQEDYLYGEEQDEEIREPAEIDWQEKCKKMIHLYDELLSDIRSLWEDKQFGSPDEWTDRISDVFTPIELQTLGLTA